MLHPIKIFKFFPCHFPSISWHSSYASPPTPRRQNPPPQTTISAALRSRLVEMDFKSLDTHLWREALFSYDAAIKNLGKTNLITLDDFYRKELPDLLHRRDPDPYITTHELSRLMEWKLARGKWRPRLLSFVSSLDDAVVRDASRKAFASFPDVSKAISELTVLKGVGPATASAVLAAYAPDLAPFMSDEVFVHNLNPTYMGVVI